jgi:hypothetical protein
MTPAAIAADLHAAINAGLDIFHRVDETRTAERRADGGWCAREILGHLVDSACNNHRRFIIGQGGGPLVFDGYDGDAWVARQRYAAVPFRDIVALWSAYNRHLAHVIACAPAETLTHSGRSPEGNGEVTLGFLMEDYVTHLRHHLDQLRTQLAASR